MFAQLGRADQPVKRTNTRARPSGDHQQNTKPRPKQSFRKRSLRSSLDTSIRQTRLGQAFARDDGEPSCWLAAADRRRQKNSERRNDRKRLPVATLPRSTAPAGNPSGRTFRRPAPGESTTRVCHANRNSALLRAGDVPVRKRTVEARQSTTLLSQFGVSGPGRHYAHRFLARTPERQV